MNSKLTETNVEPLVLHTEDTDYDTDYSQVSFHSDKIAGDVSKDGLQKDEYKKTPKINSKNVTFSPPTQADEDGVNSRRERLELILTNALFEDLLANDLHKKLQDRYEKVERTLDALAHYVDAVSLEMKACYRLCQQLNDLLITEKPLDIDQNLIKLTSNICRGTDLNFQDRIKQNIFIIMQEKEEFNTLITEYIERKDDFKIASENFQILLETKHLNIKQMNKLQKQYDLIQANYQHSGYMLDKFIPGEISERISGLLNCLSDFSGDLQRIGMERADMSRMFQQLHCNMKNSDADKIRSRKLDQPNIIEEEDSILRLT